MAFLRNKGASGRFTFDVIYSCLQKSLRRNDVDLAVEMGLEFKNYPNALKKRLMQNMTEDCPNFYLIDYIYKIPKENFNSILNVIPIICNHVKCREAQNAFRYACELKKNEEDLDGNDDMLTMLCKIRTMIMNDRCMDAICFFQQFYNLRTKLSVLYNFISKNRTFLLGLVSFYHNEYLHIKDIRINPLPKLSFTEGLTLPDYIYDKHVSRANAPKDPSGYRFTYAFFMGNLVLSPRMPETEIERIGRELYIDTDEGTGKFL